jgi:hypothetical protein
MDSLSGKVIIKWNGSRFLFKKTDNFSSTIENFTWLQLRSA